MRFSASSRILDGVVRMHDIHDVEAFIWEVIRRKMRMVQPDQMEDVVSEGFVIMCTLNARFDPSKDSRKKDDPTHTCVGARCCVPSFAGYANFILPKKLMEVFYARQPEFQVSTVDGKRTYVRYESAHSLDERNDRYRRETDNPGLSRLEDAHSTRHVTNFIAVPIIPKEDRRA